MRKTFLFVLMAAFGQAAILTWAFFAEALFPLGDLRWLFIAVPSTFLFFFLLYVQYRWERTKMKSEDQRIKDLRAEVALEKFERVTTQWPGRRVWNRLLGIDDEEDTKRS